MITRSQTRRLTSSPNPSETSLVSFATESDAENSPSFSDQSLLFDVSQPFYNSEESLSDRFLTFSIDKSLIPNMCSISLEIQPHPNLRPPRKITSWKSHLPKAKTFINLLSKYQEVVGKKN
jgi:hypothetical protein